MNNWENFNETELPSKDKFYSSLGLEDISDSDYRQANKVFEVIKLNNIGDYHDLYVQVDTVQLTDIFENFRNTCHEIYELDPVIRKNIFTCLFSVHNTISLSRHEQVCLMRLRFERYFSHIGVLVIIK